MFRNTRRLVWIAALVWAAWASPARADVAPDPQRPIDGNERPLPQPDPPPEKELVYVPILCAVAGLLLVSCLAAKASRRSPELGSP